MSDSVTHIIKVTTGDKRGAGTDGNIYISMSGDDGEWCKEHGLHKFWRNNFEKRHTDIFKVKRPDLGEVKEICVRRGGMCPLDKWYLEKVTVETLSTNYIAVFPVLRWIRTHEKLMLHEFDSSLPMFEKNPRQRAAELEKKRKDYELAEHIPGGPKQVKHMPEDERFSFDFVWDLNKLKLQMLAKSAYATLTTNKFQELSDFDQLYDGHFFPVPEGHIDWKCDMSFGNQRLNGCNPTNIKLCQRIPENFAVTEEMIKPFLEGNNLKNLLESKKIYIIDLTYLVDMECNHGRKLCGPYGLFYSNRAGMLMPLAIQLMPEPAEDNPVFLPSDPENTWLLAKMWFNLSDASEHQSITHLGLTHIAMESVAVCTHRQLSASHPMFKLLVPHFIYLIAINTRAVSYIIAPGGWADKTMTIGRSGLFDIMRHGWANWDVVERGNIVNDLRKRGVDDVEALPNYHYRDDALLLREAILKYVANIVNAIYDTEEKLIADYELQAWAEELAEAGHKGLTTPVKSTESLTEILTTFIFTASVSHAAVNFDLYNEVAFPPNYPVMLNGERPKDKNPITTHQIVKALPDRKHTLSIMCISKLLSQRHTNELSNFEVQYAYDPISLTALEQFKTDLEKVSQTIDDRNSKRVKKYLYLNPREVPNSISI